MSSNSQTTTLYIGTRNIGFLEYPLTYEGDLTPELLIQGIADSSASCKMSLPKAKVVFSNISFLFLHFLF